MGSRSAVVQGARGCRGIQSIHGAGECTCLTGIGIDRPRDAMERVAEGCWSMLRDVKSTPSTLMLSGYFFSCRPKRRVSRTPVGEEGGREEGGRGLLMSALCVNMSDLPDSREEK